MNKQARKALEESIAHWKRMYEYSRDEAMDGEAPTVDYCALCSVYIGNLCGGCPVAKKADTILCGTTPYNKAYNAYDAWINGNGTRRQWRSAAKKEIEFLESLL